MTIYFRARSRRALAGYGGRPTPDFYLNLVSFTNITPGITQVTGML